ncbi:MAG: hypothetical protein JWS11_2342 [Cypionkella sp.]|nr:hypothetical protein [Cypionkella sp.]
MPFQILYTPVKPSASVGIIATSEGDLGTCIAGLAAKGFDHNTVKLMVIRNFGVNHFDAYKGISAFLAQAAGRYLMVIHQDVAPIDRIADLADRLNELDHVEPNWALAGNSGFVGLGRSARRISDPYGMDQKVGVLPSKVWAVDENLLILNLRNPVVPSSDLSGFHFYGTDLALKARLTGRGTYVIDWHVLHASKGNLGHSWKQGLKQLETAYAGKIGTKIIQVPTTVLLFGWFAPLRVMRKSVWRTVRYGSRYLHRIGIRR